MIRTIFTAAAGFALLAGAQAGAMQKQPDGTTAEERANTARLNAEQQAKAQAETDAYNARVAAAAQTEAAAQATYAQETAAYEAEKARVAALSAEERMKWEADVAAARPAKPRVARTPNPNPGTDRYCGGTEGSGGSPGPSFCLAVGPAAGSGSSTGTIILGTGIAGTGAPPGGGAGSGKRPP